MVSFTTDHLPEDGNAVTEHGEPTAQKRVYPDEETTAAALPGSAGGGTNEEEYMVCTRLPIYQAQ
jgi:hypothetical protein